MISRQRITKFVGKALTLSSLRLKSAMGFRKKRYCPACRSPIVGFFRYGDQAEWGCPLCKASPRERLVNYLIDEGILAIPNGGTILHMAPNEISLVRRMKELAGRYRPADFDPSRYDVSDIERLDLMDLGETATLDLFYASHVMEHVPDDAKVLANIARALKPGGEAWLIVPLHDAPTIEGTPDMSGRERERRFGQWDHVRQYGLDFADRIAAADLVVEVYDATSLPDPEQRKYALGDTIFRAKKRSAP